MEDGSVVRKRNFGIDYVKFWACFSVIAVHFRLNIQDKIPVESFGPRTSFFMAVIYQMFITCVPLFLIATGFLMSNKALSINYYMSIVRIFFLYVSCSLFSYFIVGLYSGNFMTVIEVFTSILRFKLIPYSWYIEMYLGLALLFPCVNIFIERTDKKEFQFFILTMILLCSVSPIINSNPMLNKTFHLPNYWGNMYPLLYYLLGAYVKKFYETTRIRLKQLLLILGIFFFLLALGILINYSNANPKAGGAEGYYGSLIVVIQAFSLFLIIMSVFKQKNKLVRFISNHTLSIYLMSYSVDQFLYPKMIELLGSPKRVFILMPFITIFILIVSSLLAAPINKLNNLFWKSKLLKFYNSRL